MEYLNVYDEDGNFTGRIIERSKAKKLSINEHIAVGVIFIENSEGKFLMQKTSLEKGGLYSSTGGHVISGETPIESIKREVLEELGINIYNEDIIELGYIMYDMPLRFMFYLKKNIDINDIVVQKEEVECVRYMTKDEVFDIIDNGLITESHGLIFKYICDYKESVK